MRAPGREGRACAHLASRDARARTRPADPRAHPQHHPAAPAPRSGEAPCGPCACGDRGLVAAVLAPSPLQGALSCTPGVDDQPLGMLTAFTDPRASWELPSVAAPHPGVACVREIMVKKRFRRESEPQLGTSLW